MLKIVKHEADAHTGHITAHAHVVEVVGENQTVEGALETHGIAAHELKTRFGGDVKAWLRNVHEGMKQRHEARKIAATAIQALRGITMFDDEEKHGNHPASAGTEVQRPPDQNPDEQSAA